MKKENYAWWKILIGVILCFGVAIGIFIGFLLPGITDKNIAKNGTETTAIVTDIVKGSTTSVNDIETQYYRIKFTFTNGDGKEINGKTNDAYSYRDLYEMRLINSDYDINVGAQFKVKYIGDKAVAADYKNSGGNTLFWVIAVVFGAAGIIIFISYPIYLIKFGSASKIKKYGIDGIGTYLDHSNSSSTAYSNNEGGIFSQIKSGYKEVTGTSNHCRIYFSFTNDFGELIEIKTSNDYFIREAEALAAMQTFPIKYIKNKAIIALDRKQLLKAWNDNVKNTTY